MPPLPQLKIGAVEELERQLRFVPVETLRRQIERVEDLCRQIDPNQAYPEDWLVFRVTGYRLTERSPSLAAKPLLVGRALLADLVTLVERLCVAAELSESELAGAVVGEWLDADAVCERWGISRKSFDRYRRAGLPGRRFNAERGRSKLYFKRAVVEEFERAHAARLKRAKAFTRIDPKTTDKMIRLAAKYQSRLGWSMSQTAERLAERFDRAHETVRLLLKRHDDERTVRRNEAQPIFNTPGPLTDGQLRLIERAFAFGVEADELAEHLNKSKPSVYRALSLRRAARLRAIDFSQFAVSDAEAQRAARSARPLEHPSVQTGLGSGAPADLASLLAFAAANQTSDPAAEKARASAFQILVARAAADLAKLSTHHPGAIDLDEIETTLRWCARLKAELVRSQLPLFVKSVSVQLSVDLSELPRAMCVELINDCLASLMDAIDRHDPSKGGRLAAPSSLALTRALSLWRKRREAASDGPAARSLSRAMRLTNPSEILLSDWTLSVCGWQRFLEPPAYVRQRVAALAESNDDRRLLELRFGWRGAPPQTLRSVAATLDATPHHTSAQERQAIIRLRRSLT